MAPRDHDARLARGLHGLRELTLSDGTADEDGDLRPLLAGSIELARRGALADAHELRRRMRRASLRIVRGGRR